MGDTLMRDEIEAHFHMAEAMRAEVTGIEAIAAAVWASLSGDGRLYAFGNGGSASEALHFTGELVGRYKAERAPLAALALPADVAALTCIGNDYAFDEVFARQLRAHARPGDIAVGFTTSGRSANVVKGLDAARAAGAATVLFTGEAGRDAARDADHAFISPSTTTARIQEMHQLAMHLICARIDQFATQLSTEA